MLPDVHIEFDILFPVTPLKEVYRVQTVSTFFLYLLTYEFWPFLLLPTCVLLIATRQISSLQVAYVVDPLLLQADQFSQCNPFIIIFSYHNK